MADKRISAGGGGNLSALTLYPNVTYLHILENKIRNFRKRKKLSLCLALRHRGGVGGSAPLIPNLGTKDSSVVTFTLRLHYPQIKKPAGTHCSGYCVRSRAGLKDVGNNLFHLPGIEN